MAIRDISRNKFNFIIGYKIEFFYIIKMAELKNAGVPKPPPPTDGPAFSYAPLVTRLTNKKIRKLKSQVEREMNVLTPMPMPMLLPPLTKKTRKRGKRRGNTTVYDLMECDAVPTTESTSIVVRRSKRKVYRVNLAQLEYVMLECFRTNNYEIKDNPWYDYSYNVFLAARRRDFTLCCIKKYLVIMKIDLYYGPDVEHRIDYEIDVSGILLQGTNLHVLHEHTEIMQWLNGVIKIKSGTHLPCVTKTCPGALEYSRQFGRNQVTCNICTIEQCTVCQCEYTAHRDLSCTDYKLKQRDEELSCSYTLKGLIEGKIQPCPACNAMTERIDGCNSIICSNRQCRNYWCWACGMGDLQRIYPNNRHDHYNPHSNQMIRSGGIQCPASIRDDDRDNYYAKCTDQVIARNQRLFAKQLDAYRLSANANQPLTIAEASIVKTMLDEINHVQAKYIVDLEVAECEFTEYSAVVLASPRDIADQLRPGLDHRRKKLQQLLSGEIIFQTQPNTIADVMLKSDAIIKRCDQELKDHLELKDQEIKDLDISDQDFPDVINAIVTLHLKLMSMVKDSLELREKCHIDCLIILMHARQHLVNEATAFKPDFDLSINNLNALASKQLIDEHAAEVAAEEVEAKLKQAEAELDAEAEAIDVFGLSDDDSD